MTPVGYHGGIGECQLAMAANDLAIVRSIYDAALDDHAWQNLPRLLAEHLEGETAVIWCAERDGAPDFASFNQAPEFLSQYAEHFRFVDPWTDAIQRNARVSTAFHGHELISNQALLQTEFYYDFMRVADILPNVGAHMSVGPHTTSALAVYRPLNASAFEDSHKQKLQGLVGHIEQMLILRRQFGSQRQASEMTTATLNSLSSGIVICDQDAHVLFANAAAERVAAQHGTISLHSVDQNIAADQARHTTQLRLLIANAAQGGVGGALGLANQDGNRLLLTISPLPASLQDSPGRALISLRSETDTLGAAPEMLVALFGLTAAEADLAWSLTQNDSLNTIRVRRGVSENTIRSQLAHVFAKTRTANQRELVRLLSMVPAPL